MSKFRKQVERLYLDGWKEVENKNEIDAVFAR